MFKKIANATATEESFPSKTPAFESSAAFLKAGAVYFR
jgi:hypothetical protein